MESKNVTLPAKPDNSSNLVFLIVALVAITLCSLLAIVIFCIKCKIQNKSLVSFFISMIICSPVYEEKVNKYLDQFTKLSVSTQETEIKQSDQILNKAGKAEAKDAQIIAAKEKKTTESTGSVDPKINLKPFESPKAFQEFTPPINLIFKPNFTPKAKTALKLSDPQEESKSPDTTSSGKQIQAKRVETKIKIDLLNDEKVQRALKKIQDFAEKEKSRSKRHLLLKTRAEQEQRDASPQKDHESELLQEADVKESDSSKRRPKKEISTRSFKVDSKKKASTTIIDSTKKFQELNRDLKKILATKRKS